MQKILSSTFLESLATDTRQLLLRTAQLQQLPVNRLEQQPHPGKWSVAQVIEHLNTYGRYYLPRLEQAIQQAPPAAATYFVPGWLGGYFTNSMKPKANGTITHKMKAFKGHSPAPTVNAAKALQEFEQQEVLLLALLHKAGKVNINHNRIPISVMPFLTLKMGDVFAFLIAHHQRHFLQLENVLKAV